MVHKINMLSKREKDTTITRLSKIIWNYRKYPMWPFTSMIYQINPLNPKIWLSRKHMTPKLFCFEFKIIIINAFHVQILLPWRWNSSSTSFLFFIMNSSSSNSTCSLFLQTFRKLYRPEINCLSKTSNCHLGERRNRKRELESCVSATVPMALMHVIC